MVDAVAAVEVVLLGTGTPVPDPDRCGSGTAVVGPDGWVLVDCGRGVTQRTMQAGLDLTMLHGVLLTHHHSDHVSDLATLAIARWCAGAGSPLRVVAPGGRSSAFARTCLDSFDDQAFYGQADPSAGPRPSIEVREFDPAPEPTEVANLAGFAITSVLVDHHPIEAAVGYRVDVAGVRIVVSGDTAACQGIESMACDADLLIHEALLSRAVSAAALEWNAGAETVGALADRAGAARLVLTHLLPPPANARHEQAFVAEARAGGFEGPIDVAADLARIPVPGRNR